ncbi:MAG: ABC transporter permease [Candidatus Rokubacteria bacterium]|nr:ABC transporter permease [Candidatus Rokubacteria bacterium]
MHAVPGGPFDEDKMPLPPEVKQAILRSFGLDRPLWEQYLFYLWNALHLDFGYSYQSPGETVLQLLGRVWPVSMHLGGLALTLAIPVGLTLGILAARRQNSWIDYATTLLGTLTIITPHFVLAITLILVFSTTLNLLPTGGWERAEQWIMPVIAYSLGPLGIIARYTRTAMLEALRADFVVTARAKGVGELGVVMKHVFRNALLPLITIIGPMLPNLLTGSIFVEGIFRIPGLGQFFVTSIYERDYPMIMALSLLAAVLVTLVYFLTDLVYTVVDPRIRLR